MRLPPPPAWALAVLLVVAASLSAGPVLVFSPRSGAIATAATALGGTVGYALGRATAQPAGSPLRIRPRAARRVLQGAAVVGSLALMFDAPAWVAPLVAGWLLARGSGHDSDALMLGTLWFVGLAVVRDPEGWGEGTAFVLPVLIVTLAVALREAWDLSDLAAATRPLPRKTNGPEEGPRSQAGVALARGAGALAALAVAAGGFGLVRKDVGASLVAALGADARLLLFFGLVLLAGGAVLVTAGRAKSAP